MMSFDYVKCNLLQYEKTTGSAWPRRQRAGVLCALRANSFCLVGRTLTRRSTGPESALGFWLRLSVSARFIGVIPIDMVTKAGNKHCHHCFLSVVSGVKRQTRRCQIKKKLMLCRSFIIKRLHSLEERIRSIEGCHELRISTEPEFLPAQVGLFPRAIRN